MTRKIITLAVTAGIMLSLLAFTQPTSAVLTTVTGPQEVNKPDTIDFGTTIEIREDERIPIDSFNLVIETEEGESVTVTFARNGMILDITPTRGVVGQGEIRINLLRRSLNITPVASNAGYGYGYRSGANERTGTDRSFGYGYGFGSGEAGQPSFAYHVSMDSKAFKHGEYSLHVSVNTDDGTAFASNDKAFEVLRPANENAGNNPGNDASGTDRGTERPGAGPRAAPV